MSHDRSWIEDVQNAVIYLCLAFGWWSRGFWTLSDICRGLNPDPVVPVPCDRRLLNYGTFRLAVWLKWQMWKGLYRKRLLKFPLIHHFYRYKYIFFLKREDTFLKRLQISNLSIKLWPLSCILRYLWQNHLERDFLAQDLDILIGLL